jgi:hypothetical protein
MSKPKQQVLTPPAPPPARDWPALVRRGLIILVTGLLVARPLVLGEDPGLLDPASDSGGLWLTFLWLAAAVGWAGWRLWYGQGVWHGGLVELGLLLAAGCYFVSAGYAASYRHPAWLIACEWAVLLVCLSLVRQLAGTAESRRGFLAALLATGVCLAAFGVYQAAFELPYQHNYYRDRETLRRDWERLTGRPLSRDDPELDYLAERVQMNHVYGTFTNPNSFAGYLALLLPATVGFAVVAWRRRDTTWQIVAALFAAGLVAAALFLTHSRGANLAVLLVGAGLALWFGRHFVRRHLAWAAGGLALLVVAGVAASRVPGARTAVNKAGQSLGLRLNYWTAARGMIRDHPWLGIGPGNFRRHYARYMVSTTHLGEKITDPHNFAFEVWTSAGVFALAGLALALGTFAWRLGRAGRRPAVVPRDPPPGPDEVPWEFYTGGMVGLVLAFVLQASAAPTPDHVWVWGAEAVGRSVVWFAAFALFWGIPWTGPSVVLALAAGLAACLLNLGVSGGIGFPSVAQPFWAVAGLALALAAADRPGWVLRPGLALFLPLPALAAAALVYFLLVLLPVTGCDYHLRHARLRQDDFRSRTGTPDPKVAGVATEHLNEARKADPTNVQPPLQTALWRLELNPTGGPAVFNQALADLDPARQLDPLGKEIRTLLFEVRLRLLAPAPEKDRPTVAASGARAVGLLGAPAGQGPLLAAAALGAARSDHQRQLDAAEEAADAVLAVDPTETARLHARLAERCFAVNDWKAGYRYALTAWQEDRDAQAEPARPAYQLTALRRHQMERSVLGAWAVEVSPVFACAPQGPLHVLPAFVLNPELSPPRPPAPPRR